MSILAPIVTSRSLDSLPIEIVEKIIVFAADSGGQNATLDLCLVCRLFYESAIKRLYHTISIDNIWALERMLKTSALQKPWVAACVRVLLLPFNIYGDEFPQASVTQALTEFTGLISFCRPSKAIFDVSSPLPRLRRLVQIYDAHLPPSIAQYLTHLYLFGNIVHSASLILQMKATLECLTHILLVNAVGWPAGFVEVMDVLEPNVPHGLPKFLQVFVMFTGSDVNDMGNPEHNDLWRKARKVVDADPRIILWSSIGSKGAPDSWIGPRLCEYKTRGLMSECLGALSDGEQGIWEAVERWVLEAAKTPQA